MVGLGLLVALLARTGLSSVWSALQQADWGQVCVAGLVAALVLLNNSMRWVYLGRCIQPDASARGLVSAYLTTSFLSNLTPGRLGELTGPLLMEYRGGVPRVQGAAIIVVDRITDLMLVASLSLGSAFYVVHYTQRGDDIGTGMYWGATVLLGLGAGLIALIVLSQSSAQNKPLDRAPPPQGGFEGLRSKVFSLLGELRAALGQVITPQRLVCVTLLAAVGWSLQLIGVYVVVNAFTPISFLHSAVCHTASIIAGLVSMVPGGVGVTTTGYVVMAGMFGYDWERIVPAGIVYLVLVHCLRFVFSLLGEGLHHTHTNPTV
ncbi:MAG: lysylphosphatidylglycerol synthase transmembrane domain-containing protein [Myxococcota bacterium]